MCGYFHIKRYCIHQKGNWFLFFISKIRSLQRSGSAPVHGGQVGVSCDVDSHPRPRRCVIVCGMTTTLDGLMATSRQPSREKCTQMSHLYGEGKRSMFPVWDSSVIAFSLETTSFSHPDFAIIAYLGASRPLLPSLQNEDLCYDLLSRRDRNMEGRVFLPRKGERRRQSGEWVEKEMRNANLMKCRSNSR